MREPRLWPRADRGDLMPGTFPPRERGVHAAEQRDDQAEVSGDGELRHESLATCRVGKKELPDDLVMRSVCGGTTCVTSITSVGCSRSTQSESEPGTYLQLTYLGLELDRHQALDASRLEAVRADATDARRQPRLAVLGVLRGRSAQGGADASRARPFLPRWGGRGRTGGHTCNISCNMTACFTLASKASFGHQLLSLPCSHLDLITRFGNNDCPCRHLLPRHRVGAAR